VAQRQDPQHCAAESRAAVRDVCSQPCLDFPQPAVRVLAAAPDGVQARVRNDQGTICRLAVPRVGLGGQAGEREHRRRVLVQADRQHPRVGVERGLHPVAGAPGDAPAAYVQRDVRGASTSPARTSPARTSAARTSAARTSPARTSPARTSPARTSTARTSPMRASPARPSPARTCGPQRQIPRTLPAPCGLGCQSRKVGKQTTRAD